MTAPAFEDLQQAADWFAVLQDASASDDDRARWQRWLETGPGRHAAWQRVQAVAGEFAAIKGLPARQALERGAAPGRRRAVLRGLAVVPVASLAGWVAVRELPWRGWVAAHRTGVGERREMVLADGSRVWLNTDSAMDVDFSPTLRRVVLHRGEVLITSGHDDTTAARPLVVDAPQARLTALGTRFAVRHEEGGAVRLAVFEGAVRAQPLAGGAPRLIRAGEATRVYADRAEPPVTLSSAGDDWTRGMLVADAMRLDDFLAELGRHFAGHLGCASSVADLRIVGAYPLADLDRVLHALQATLPIKVYRPLPWWVAVGPAPGSGQR